MIDVAGDRPRVRSHRAHRRDRRRQDDARRGDQPARRRSGRAADRAARARRGPGRGPLRGRRRRARRRPRRAGRRSLARVHRRAPGHRGPAGRARRPHRRPPRSARPPEPAVLRRPARRAGPLSPASTSTELRAARARLTEIDAAWPPSAATPAAGCARSTCSASSSASSTPPTCATPTRTPRWPSSQDDAGRRGRAPHRRSACRRPAGRRRGRRRPRRRRRGASSPTARRTPRCAVRLRAVVAELGDVAAELRGIAESIDEDPERLAAIGERRQLLADLRRKYGDSLAEVIDPPRGRPGAAGRAGGLRRPRRRAGGRAGRGAWPPSGGPPARSARARRTGAVELGPAVERHLRTLAMPHADLAVRVGDDDPGDDVVIELAANPGSPPLPLARAASGGELARTMLALRLVLSEAPDTLVFDEVDAGVGGAAALAVGEALAALGRAPPGARRHPPRPGRRAGRRTDRRGQGRRRRADGRHGPGRHGRRAHRRGGPDAVRPADAARQRVVTPPSSSASAPGGAEPAASATGRSTDLAWRRAIDRSQAFWISSAAPNTIAPPTASRK